ncbi:MAG: DsbA family protein [Alphaproteobacteria bacterium]|nr:MAG: DsbA family protein [Alphaproteobacteria bacterium]
MRRYNSTTYSMDNDKLALSRRHFVISGSLAPLAVGAGAGLIAPTKARADEAKEPTISDDDHVLGDPKAPISIIEYASLTCPHCAHFHEATFPDLKKNWIDTGKASLTFRHFPLDRYAFQASVLTECGSKSTFFGLVGLIFNQQVEWTHAKDPVEALAQIGKTASIGEKKFKDCLADEKLGESILNQRLVGANDYGVDATPTLFVNGKKYEGDRSYEEFDTFLKSLM